jgi:maleate cis-trans isomerase
MFEAVLPKRKLGILSPMNVIDNNAYEFYRLAPPGIMLVITGVGLREFSAADVERVFEPLDTLADSLMERGIDLILQSGVPLPILIGVEAHDRIVARLARRTGKPATSSIIGVCGAAKHLGMKRIAVANKWTPAMNKTLAEFFARDGVEVVGVAAEIKTPAEFTKMGTEESIDLAYRLGRQAFEDFPQADGVYIGGGSWLVQPALERLEQEFAKPVLSNQSSVLWDMLHKVDFWKPIQGHGRLLAGS